MKKLISFALLLALSLPAYGVTFKKGHDLLDACKEVIKHQEGLDFHAVKAGECFGYITSVNDTSNLWADWRDFERSFCIPDGTKIGRLIFVVVDHLEAHPEQLQLDASSLATNSFQKTFPCN